MRKYSIAFEIRQYLMSMSNISVLDFFKKNKPKLPEKENSNTNLMKSERYCKMYPKHGIQQSRLPYEGRSSRHEKIFLKNLSMIKMTKASQDE
jgi:hypothetical protein